jgi:DNA-binding NtrC family response regulator
MPARIVFVHDEPVFRDAMFVALANAGLSFAWYPDALLAMDALEAARRVQLIITRIRFPDGRSNGLSLVQCARMRDRTVRTIFAEDLELQGHVSDEGRFFIMPVDPATLMRAVHEELAEYEKQRQALYGVPSGPTTVTAGQHPNPFEQ